MIAKPIRLESKVSFVPTADSAVDWDAIVKRELDLSPQVRDDATSDAEYKRRYALKSFHARYGRASGLNPSAWKDFLPMKPGESPTVFVIGVINSDDIVRLADECKVDSPEPLHNELGWSCFLHAVRDIENFPGDVPKIKRGQVEYVDPVWLKANFVMGLRNIAVNVGLIAWRWNQITETDIKN